ncbi:DUF2637 domain-containing protein [Streptomyces adonidis]|uniref:DUF2637 domain-containing protein n=1 Tax=Streptomyces adonidis TaxID=3231367 RepID=UPI0034DB1FD5
MTRPEEGVGARRNRRRVLDPDVRVRPLCGLTVAGVAAYASYVHQRAFAMQGGADRVSALLWPLSVDGLSPWRRSACSSPPGPARGVPEARCGRLSCWGSWSRWRRTSRRPRLRRGSRCWSPGGHRSPCCCQWNSLSTARLCRRTAVPPRLRQQPLPG